MNRRGLTLLEVMVALVILGLVVTGYLQLFSATARSVGRAEAWSHAVAYAEQGMELAKLDLPATLARGREPLDGGFARQLSVHPAAGGLRRVTVTILFPDGGQFALERLFEDP